MAIVLVVVAALVVSQLLPQYLGGRPAASPPPPPGYSRDFCVPENGSNCKGFSFSLPYTSSTAVINTTGCDPVPSVGNAEVLWLNYSAAAAIDAIVLPSSVFSGSGGWSLYAFAMVRNPSVLDASLWFSHLASGSFTESIHVPAGGGTYCLGWWEPASAPVSVTWLSDLNVTYQ